MPGPFDLRRFAPPDVKFIAEDDREYRLHADPMTPDLVRMLRITNTIGSMDIAEMPDAYEEAYDLLLRFVQERMPDVQAIPIRGRQIITVFQLVLHGDTVAEAVFEAITAGDTLSAEETSADEPDDAKAEHGVDGPASGESGPLASTRPSSAPSSRSEDGEAGLPATGTG